MHNSLYCFIVSRLTPGHSLGNSVRHWLLVRGSMDETTLFYLGKRIQLCMHIYMYTHYVAIFGHMFLCGNFINLRFLVLLHEFLSFQWSITYLFLLLHFWLWYIRDCFSLSLFFGNTRYVVTFSMQTVLCHLPWCAKTQVLAHFNFMKDIALEAYKKFLTHLNSDITACYV